MKKRTEMLLFKCKSCHTAIHPLTFFDGSVWCPHCKTNLFKKLMEKADNREGQTAMQDVSFPISQELFAKYLCEDGGRDTLRSAIDYCRKAAYALDPYALLNLGYFYSLGYVEGIHVETGRSFARLCFDLAKRCAPKDDGNFLTLVDSNLQALAAPFKKVLDSDVFYLTGLTDRMKKEDAATAPRLGVFSVKNVKKYDEETYKRIIELLKSLFGMANVYCQIKNPTNAVLFGPVPNPNSFDNCFDNFDDQDCVWFAYKRKGEPAKGYKKILSKPLGNTKEVLENLSAIYSAVSDAENRGVDFSDQDILICTFGEIYSAYDIDKARDDSPFDRLSKIYRTSQQKK